MAELPVLDSWDLILRVVGAGALGGLVGLERELSDQPAGFRTHILVSLGAALFTLAGAFGLTAFFAESPEGVTFDPTRVAAQVVTGIGFLGAGAIIRQGVSIRGLTTAAALWVTAAIGTAVALGFWEGAITTTGVTVSALYGFKRLERRFLSRLKRGRYEFVIDATPHLKVSDLAQIVEAHKGRMASVQMDTDDEGNVRISMVLRLPATSSAEEFVDLLSSIEGVSNVELGR